MITPKYLVLKFADKNNADRGLYAWDLEGWCYVEKLPDQKYMVEHDCVKRQVFPDEDSDGELRKCADRWAALVKWAKDRDPET